MRKLIGLPFDSIKTGQSASFTKTFSAEDIAGFADMTGDINPLHLDSQFAQSRKFEGKIAHGLLTASLISAVLGTQLPGPGTIYLSQNIDFFKPVYPEDTITATVTVIEKIQEKKRLIFECVCNNQNGIEVLKGQAVVLAPKERVEWELAV